MSRSPLLCLPGIVRTSGDFETLAHAIGAGRRVVAPDYPGRGQSGRSRDISRYAPEACLRDVLDICAALHLHRRDRHRHQLRRTARHGFGVRRVRRCCARLVLNDIGPDIGSDGADFVRRFIGNDIAFADIDAAVAHLRAVLPPLSLDSDEAWRAMTALTYAPDGDGMLRPVWDTRIAGLMNGGTPDLWALFGGAGASAAAAGARRGQRHSAAGHRRAHAGDASRHGGGIAARHRPCTDADRAGDCCGATGVSGRPDVIPAPLKVASRVATVPSRRPVSARLSGPAVTSRTSASSTRQ